VFVWIASAQHQGDGAAQVDLVQRAFGIVAGADDGNEALFGERVSNFDSRTRLLPTQAA